MAKARITKQAVESARAGEKDQLLWDDRLSGFGLKVTPKGSKIFVYQYRLGGRGSPVRRYTIGKYGALTPDQARRHAETLALQSTQGIDPQREKVKSARLAVDLAFKPYIERFAEGCLRVDWPASHKYAQSLLVAHAVPILGTQSLSDIKRRDVLGVLATVKDKAATATNLYRVMRRMFRWAVEQEDITRSPIEGMRPPTPPSSRARAGRSRAGFCLAGSGQNGISLRFSYPPAHINRCATRRSGVIGLVRTEPRKATLVVAYREVEKRGLRPPAAVRLSHCLSGRAS